MSTTLKVANGHIVFNPANGQLVEVTGERKAAQDIAEVLLQDYSTEQEYGSYLRRLIANPIPYAQQLFIQYYIAEAIKTLEQKQLQDPYISDDEKIDSIVELVTTTPIEGTVAFYVRVETVSKKSASIGVIPTQLEQQWEA